MDFILPILLSSALHFHFDTNQLEVPTDLQSANVVQLYTDSTIKKPHLGMIRSHIHHIHHVHSIRHHQHRSKFNKDKQSSIQDKNDRDDGIIGFGTILGILYFMFKK